MAFNFNWSPLTADADFYSRARDLLTKALNKSPKPPIIVDDILVSEFNLGTVPPDLEILEIGDLAEDRFRGIFKMCYSGDAFMTLKTRVQVRFFISSPSSRGATGSENARSPSAHLHHVHEISWRAHFGRRNCRKPSKLHASIHQTSVCHPKWLRPHRAGPKLPRRGITAPNCTPFALCIAAGPPGPAHRKSKLRHYSFHARRALPGGRVSKHGSLMFFFWLVAGV